MSEASKETDDCVVSCEGLYADIEFSDGISSEEDSKILMSIIRHYNSHKEKILKNMAFDLKYNSLSKN